MIEISLSWLDLDSGCEALDGLVEVATSIERDSFVIVGVGVLWINLYSGCVVLDCKAKLAELVVSESSVKQCFEVIGIDIQGL